MSTETLLILLDMVVVVCSTAIVVAALALLRDQASEARSERADLQAALLVKQGEYKAADVIRPKLPREKTDPRDEPSDMGLNGI